MASMPPSPTLMGVTMLETTSHGSGCLCGRCGSKDDMIAQLQNELNIANYERSRIGALVGMVEHGPGARYSYGDVFDTVDELLTTLRRDYNNLLARDTENLKKLIKAQAELKELK